MSQSKFENSSFGYRLGSLVLKKIPHLAIIFLVLVIGLQSSSVEAQSIKEEFEAAAQREAQLVERIAQINTDLQTVQADLDQARRLVTKSELTIEETAAQKELLSVRIDALKEELESAAIEGYVSSDSVSSDSSDVNTATERLRATNLLSRIQKTRAELISELGLLIEEDRILDFSFAEATRIREDNLRIQETKEAELLRQKEIQQELYESVKQELDDLEAEAIASAELDDELRALITSRQKNTATIEGPLRWPLNSVRITSSFGNRVHPIYGTVRLHAGIDLCPADGSCAGAPVNSAGPGTVIFSGWKSGYGNTVIVDHGGGITTLYAHLSSINVSESSSILGQERVGSVGSTGNVTGAHLHFEVRVNGDPQNPQNYLN